MPERYLQILSILGTTAIIGFHCGIRQFAAGWMAVVLFFVLAAMRMAAAIERDEQTLQYGWRRLRRFAPEFLCVYVVSLLLLAFWPSAGLGWFAMTGPMFLHNWTRFFFEPAFQDLVFGPSWFLGALMQLQLLCLALRPLLRRLSSTALFSSAIAVGLVTRLAIAAVVGMDNGEITVSLAEAIYWTPFAHVDSIAAGYIVGRGDWRSLGRWAPAAVGAAAILGAVNLALDATLPIWSMGYPLGLARHFEFLWGYPILAVAAASIASPSNPLRQWVDGAPHLALIDRMVEFLACLPFGVYLFHGAWIVLAIQAFGMGLGRMLFVVATAGSVLSAWLFRIVHTRLTRKANSRSNAAHSDSLRAQKDPATAPSSLSRSKD